MQLVINTFGASIHKDGQIFIVRVRDQKVPISPLKVRSILITTAAHLSTDAIQLAAQHHIDLVFLDKYGEPYGRFWHSKMGSTAAIRRKQIVIADTPDGLSIVLAWIQAKLRNQADFLKELQRHRPKRRDLFIPPLQTLADSALRLQSLQAPLDACRNSIMGLEGAAARVYFDTLSQLMPEAFRFSGRSRMPAKNEFNAMLNYAYGVLYSLVERACIIAGLDPFVGFLHTDNYNKKSLVFDLIEPFRIVAERVVVHLFTGRNVKKEYFQTVPGGLSLNQDGKPVLINALNEALEKTIRWPVQGAYLNARRPLNTGTSAASDNSHSSDPSPSSPYRPLPEQHPPKTTLPPTSDHPDDPMEKETQPEDGLTPPETNPGSPSAAKSGKHKTRNIKTRDIIQFEAHALANFLIGKNQPPPKVIETEGPDFQDDFKQAAP